MGKVVLCLKDVNLRNAGRLIDDLNVKWTECLRKNLDFSHLRVKSILFVKIKETELLFAPAVYPDMHALVPKSKERCCYGQTFKEVS